MPWFFIVLFFAGGLALAAILCCFTIRWLGRREPYAAFIRLPNRRKLTFCRLLLQDNWVPLYIRILPLVVAVYIISPTDLLPGIVLDDIAIALLALVLILKFTPREVFEDLVRQAPGDTAHRNVRDRGHSPT